MKAIVIATKTAKCLPVLISSIDQYVPKDVVVMISGSNLTGSNHQYINITNNGSNFGESYNELVNQAFEMFSHIIVANDDIVLTPTSYQKLVSDYEYLGMDLPNNALGWIAAKSDYCRGAQNIREFSKRNGIRYEEEDAIIRTDVISPLFAAITKEAWVDYPPINWYSDDVQCLDIEAKGYENYASSSYVHHVGSQTIGMDHQKNHLDAEEWLRHNRPNLHKQWFK
jgi:hypothetical protein